MTQKMKIEIKCVLPEAVKCSNTQIFPNSSAKMVSTQILRAKIAGKVALGLKLEYSIHLGLEFASTRISTRISRKTSLVSTNEY